MIQYGLISKVDSSVLERTMGLICEQFNDVEFLEVGIYAGETGHGVTQYFTSKKVASWWNGIDNLKDKEKIIYTPDNFIIGNSLEVYNQIQDNSQHLIFVDGDHSLIGVIGDFFAYAPKVKVGGYLAFHDTGKHIKPFTDFQHGDKGNPDAYISVRKALKTIGLLDTTYTALEADGTFLEQWELIFDEADETDRCGGICVFKRLY